MINNLQSAIDKKTTIKEEHELNAKQLFDPLNRREIEAQNLDTEFCDNQGPIEICTEKIEVCEKKIKEMEQKINVIGEKSINTQERLNDLTLQLLNLKCNYDTSFKEIDERFTKQDGHMAKFDGQLTKQDEQLANYGKQMAEQDEMIATCVKDIDDIKKKPYDSDDSPGKSG